MDQRDATKFEREKEESVIVFSQWRSSFDHARSAVKRDVGADLFVVAEPISMYLMAMRRGRIDKFDNDFHGDISGPRVCSRVCEG